MKSALEINDCASPTGGDKEYCKKRFDRRQAKNVKLDKEIERLSLSLAKLSAKSASKVDAGGSSRGKRKKSRKGRTKSKQRISYVANSGEEVSFPYLLPNPTGYARRVVTDMIQRSLPIDIEDSLISNLNVDNKMFDHLEGILLLCVSLYDSKTYLGMISAFISYCKQYHIKKPIIVSLTQALTATHNEYAVQGGFVDTVCNFIDNWSDLVHLPIFNYVGRIIAICVSLGLCSASNLTFQIQGITIFAAEALKKQASAGDLLGAVLNTVRYFLTAGAEAFKTGSFRPFMFPNQRVAAIDTLYYDVRVAMSLFSSGNLASSAIKSEADLSAAITKLIDELIQIKCVEKDVILKRIIEQRLAQAYEWRGEFVARSAGGQLRVAPYTFLIWGKSGYGKSAIAMNLIQSILCANSFDYTDSKRVVMINSAEKFISNAKADTLAYIFDDMGAENPKFQEINHARRWLDMSNNVAGYANMADIQDKGMCTFNHKVQVGTANHKDGGMDMFSTYKVAVARRGTRDLVKLLPAYANTEGSVDTAKVLADFPSDPTRNVIPDIYTFTVEKAVEDPANPGNYTWRVVDWLHPVTGLTVQMIDVPYAFYVSYHIDQSRQHFAFQNNWVKEASTGTGKLCLCTKCGTINSLCGCPYTTQFGFEDIMRNVANQLLVRYSNEILDMGSRALQTLRTRTMMSLVPNFIYRSPLFQQYIVWHIQNVTSRYAGVALGLIWCIFLFVNCYLGSASYYMWCSIAAITAFGKCILDRIAGQAFLGLMDGERHAMHLRVIELQRRFMSFVAYSAGIIVLLKCYHMYNSVARFKVQGNLSPQHVEDIDQRDAEQNMWARAITSAPEVQERSERSCLEHLQNIVRKNQLYVSGEGEGRRPFSNAFMIKTGFCVMPHHMLYDDAREYIFQRNSPEVFGTSFKAMISKRDSVLIPDTDLALVYVPSCGDYKDLSKYLAVTIPASGWASLVYKKKDGTFADPTNFKFRIGKISCHGMALPTIKALEYTLPYSTFCGLCCGTLITTGKSPTICGFHSVGVVDDRKGACSPITLQLFNAAAQELSNRYSSVVHLAEKSQLYEVQLGISFIESYDLHRKSPLNFVPKDLVTSGEPIASVIGRSRMDSKIRPTSIAAKVREEFQLPLAYGGPKFYLGRHWRDHLLKCVTPSRGCSQSLLEAAVRDYKQLQPQLLSISRVVEQIVPLSRNATINGIDGVRFMDRMKTTSSMGFPINRSKSQFLTMCDGPNAVNYDLPDEIWDAVTECEEIYLQGKRYYPIFRACPKDEVKPSDSTKVRIFEAAPIVLQVLIRKYFLPVARVLSLYPLDSECAVGINAVSNEWQQLMDHVRKFGKERMIAGDYSGFDTRMPAQFTIAAFSICISIAEASGNYSSRDLAIMRALVADVVHPLIALNGDLLMLFGTNPSGQNLTVYINSIVNSLYLRCAFLSMYPEKDFRDHVGLSTYGDDFIGSVSTLCPAFNFKSLKDFLAQMDIKLTLPDKSESDVEYLSFSEVDFLKRKSRYHEELEFEVGVLDEESILKSLVCQELSSVVTPNEQLAGAVCSALHEWFYYGREVYNDRLAKLNEIMYGFDHKIEELSLTYETRVAMLLDSE